MNTYRDRVRERRFTCSAIADDCRARMNGLMSCSQKNPNLLWIPIGLVLLEIFFCVLLNLILLDQSKKEIPKFRNSI